MTSPLLQQDERVIISQEDARAAITLLKSLHDVQMEPAEYDVDDMNVVQATERLLTKLGEPVYNKWVCVEEGGIVWRDSETHLPMVADSREDAEQERDEEQQERDEQVANGDRDADDVIEYEVIRCHVQADGSLLLRDGRVIPSNDML